MASVDRMEPLPRPGLPAAAAVVPPGAPTPAPVLAIVSPSFNQVSETFVADHARTLAPGRTVLVCEDSRGAETFGVPVLSHLQPAPGGLSRAERLWERAAAQLNRRLGHGPVLGFQDRLRLMEFLRAHGVTVVLGEFGYSGTMVADVCERLGLPLYVYFRGHDARNHVGHPAIERRYRRLFRQAAGIICVSRYVADQLVEIGCPESLLHVNPSGVLPDKFPPSRAEPGRIVAVGRLVEMKAPDLTIEAFARVAGRFPEARLDMVGDGPLRARCEALIAERGLAGRVTLHGAQGHDAVAALMSRAAIFVQHSVTSARGDIEGFPTAIAEAMSSELPVVSTIHSGIPEHVKDGVSGRLSPERDVEGMAAALADLLADPALARRMGAAGRLHALEHLDRARSRATVRRILGLPEQD